MAHIDLAPSRGTPSFQFSQLRDNSLFRATTIVATFLLLGSTAAWLLPRQIADAAATQEKPALVTAPWKTPVKKPTQDLIAATFDLLQPLDAAPPTKRVVQTVPVPAPGTQAVASIAATVSTTSAESAIAAPAPLTSPVTVTTPAAVASPVEAPAPVQVATIEPAPSVAAIETAPVVSVEPAPVVKANPNVIASHESVNVRSGPGRSEAKVFVLEAGDEVTVTERHRGWLHIVNGKRSGWAYSDSFEDSDVKALTVGEVAVATEVDTVRVPEAAPAAKPARVQAVAPKAKATPTGSYAAKVLGSGVTVRSGPGKGNGALFALAPGKTVTVLQTQSGWLMVTDAQGRRGWIYKDFVRSL